MNHLKRLSWPILIFLVCVLVASRVGMSQANFEVIIFKYLIFCPSVVLVHLSRKQLFPYVDMQGLIKRTDVGGAAWTLGLFLFYTVLIYALTQAI